MIDGELEDSYATLNAYGGQFSANTQRAKSDPLSDLVAMSLAALQDERARRAIYVIARNIGKADPELLERSDFESKYLRIAIPDALRARVFLASCSASSPALADRVHAFTRVLPRLKLDVGGSYLLLRDGLDPFLDDANVIARDVRGLNSRFPRKANVL